MNSRFRKLGMKNGLALTIPVNSRIIETSEENLIGTALYETIVAQRFQQLVKRVGCSHSIV
jgi:hypothetical protein